MTQEVEVHVQIAAQHAAWFSGRGPARRRLRDRIRIELGAAAVGAHDPRSCDDLVAAGGIAADRHEQVQRGVVGRQLEPLLTCRSFGDAAGALTLAAAGGGPRYRHAGVRTDGTGVRELSERYWPQPRGAGTGCPFEGTAGALAEPAASGLLARFGNAQRCKAEKCSGHRSGQVSVHARYLLT